jgi:acyl-CoA thioesterase YciA
MTEQPFELVTSHHVLTQNLGVSGNLFGGTLLAWVDEAAVLYANRVALNTFVTYELERVRFLRPCKTADAVELLARVTRFSRSGLELEMKVERLDRDEGDRDLVLTTKVVLVAVDAEGRKTALRLQTGYEGLAKG